MDLKLQQSKFLAGTRSIYINKTGDIFIQNKNFLNSKEYNLKIFDLDPNFERIKNTDIKWLIAAISFFIASMFVIYEAILHGALIALYSPIYLIPTFICFYKYQNNSFDITAVFFYETGKNAFNIWNNKPNKNFVNSFKEKLKHHIERSHINQNTSDDEKIILYSKYIRFFLEEGVLSEVEAEKLLQRTVKRDEQRKRKKNNLVFITNKNP